jgi:hypothetical protein
MNKALTTVTKTKLLQRALLVMAGVSVLGVGVVGTTMAVQQSNGNFLAKQDASQTYASTVRLYLNCSFASSPKAGNSAGTYMDMVSSSSATDGIAAYLSGNGEYVADLLQATAGGSSSSVSSSNSLRLYYQEGTTYWHPNDGNNYWAEKTNYLYMAFTPGYSYQIKYTGFNHGYDNEAHKWFDYSVTTLGQFIHFDSNGGVLPSGQAETIEVDGSSFTLPSACTRSTNDGYAFTNWTYNGISADAGSSETVVDGIFNVYANYAVTAASFASYIMDSTRDSESCATKYNAAKTLAGKMTDAEKAKFEPVAYSAAYQRWQNWKAANSDSTTTPAGFIGSQKDSTVYTTLGIVTAIGLVLTAGFFFVRRKHVA